MSGAPFRDLFVELPSAVFEALQAIGEAAVERATTKRPSTARGDSSPWFGRPIAAALASRHGLAAVELSRDPWESRIIIDGRRRCGHRLRGLLDERVILASDQPAILSAIDAAIERAERTCCCMEPQR